MFTVYTFDDAACDDVMVFSGSLTDCRNYVGDATDEYYIVAPDGFTTID